MYLRRSNGGQGGGCGVGYGRGAVAHIQNGAGTFFPEIYFKSLTLKSVYFSLF